MNQQQIEGLMELIDQYAAMQGVEPYDAQVEARDAIEEKLRESVLKPLSDQQIEKLREHTFSTTNPYCPCDSKTMRKAVQAAERAHGIEEPPCEQPS